MAIAALTREEFIAAAQNEVRILLHLASKIEPQHLDYRPSPKQRSTIELLRYLAIMGPELIKGIKAGAFDGASWGAAQERVANADLKQTLAEIEKQSALYATELGTLSDEQFREGIDLFGMGKKASRGTMLSHLVIGGHAAYRTQLFLYLKALGREELNTFNLWMGIDAPAAAATT